MTKIITKARMREFDNFALARRGNRYAFGGAFTHNPKDSTDCSGLVFQSGAFIMGRTDWSGNRYGSTESFRLNHATVYNLGFKRLPAGGLAALPFKPIMLVGLQHGGGGIYSHTACTMFHADIPGGPIKQSVRGIDWESKGGDPGVFYYHGARAWNDPLFHDFWYLDAKLEDSSHDDRAVVLAEATGLSVERAAQILPTLSAGLKLAHCINPNRIAMALAQWGHESDGFKATEEYASGSAYEGRTDLGNTQPGDGVRFKGRSWIQITGRHNYGRFSKWAYDNGLIRSPSYFVDHPEDLADMEFAGVGAAWYWTVARPQINSRSDALDLYGVTRLINGGLNGIDDRKARYDRARRVGSRLLTLLDEPTTNDNELEAVLADNTSFPSLSPYRTDDKPVLNIQEVHRQNNAMLHAELIERAALQGYAPAVAMVAKLAQSQGPGSNDKFKVGHAQQIIRNIQANIAS